MQRTIQILSIVIATTFMLTTTKAVASGCPTPYFDRVQHALGTLKAVVEAGKYKVSHPQYALSKLRDAAGRAHYIYSDIYNVVGLSKSAEAFKVTFEKLRDHGLTTSERVDVGLDCLAVAIRELVTYENRFTTSTQTAYRLLQLARGLSEAKFFTPVEEILDVAKVYLRRPTCPLTSSAFAKAIEAINVAIDKVQDATLSLGEKQFFALDCIGVAEKHLRQVGAY